MINPKQRAFLKSLSHSMEPIMNIGKHGVNAEFVQHIGNKFVIYRRKRKDKDRIELPE